MTENGVSITSPHGKAFPRWKCHKEVWALKIREVVVDPDSHFVAEAARMLVFEDPAYASLRVEAEYVLKHRPQAGGYFVMYDDGYQSWSPAKAFEDGYTLVS